jgi:hypothetical protein
LGKKWHPVPTQKTPNHKKKVLIVDPAAGIEHILVGYHQPKIWILDGTKRTHMAISAPKPKPGDLIELVTIHIRS